MSGPGPSSAVPERDLEVVLERGDFRAAGAWARGVLARDRAPSDGDASPDDRRRAAEILERIGPDRAVVGLIAACLVFLGATLVLTLR